MRVFTQIFTLQTIGGVREKTNTIGVYIYRTGSELGEAGAISVILVIIMLAVSGYYIRSVLRQEGI
jgi:N,N'-diacetylchitobiose transport system permease protein